MTTENANPMKVGEVVGGRYRITRVIGEGGMGIVYEGEQKMGSTMRKVAIKTLHAELSKDPSVTKRFHRECGTVAQLEHPNTIRVYDFGATPDGTLYIAMEYLKGRPLDKVIEQEGALEPARVLKLLRQISGSLDEAHRQGIVHRDLKPENVILIERAGEKDVVKLLDFGIAARTESADAEKEAKLTQQGMVLGTPPYMSPEQFTGKALDKRSDIYSLAIMAYEMLTGTLPFDANTPWEWATQHMTAQPRPFEATPVSSKIPPGMQAAILKGLAKDRDERFNTAPEFIAALEAGADGVVVDSGPASSIASAATAAMDAVPDFGGVQVAAPTAAMPAQPASSQGSPNTGGGVAIPQPPPASTAGRRGASSGGNKGLIIGLGAVAVLLLGGIGLAMVGGGDDTVASPGPLDLGTTTETASAASAEKPAPVASNDSVVDGTDVEPDAVVGTPSEEDNGSKHAAKPPAPSKPPPAKAGSTTPKEPPKSDNKKPDKPKPPASTGNSEACTKCIQLATRGQIESAAVQYRQCSDASKKSSCQARARQTAGRAANQAKKSGDCVKARRIQAAAHSMGAGSSGLDSVANSCQ